MSTRGVLCFATGDRLVVTYNHSDSYPAWLGRKVLEWTSTLKTNEAIDEAKAKVLALRLVNSDEEPTDDERERYKHLWEGVSTGRGWYSLLRQQQGNPQMILDAGIAEVAADFPFDSLFCEWGYVVDLDARQVEVYRGFQSGPTTEGRFAGDASEGGYGPIRPCAFVPFGQYPTTSMLDNIDEQAS